jgi:hypothetical protein
MNKSGAIVNKMQLKENETCLKDFQNEKLPMSFEACTIADRKKKVAKAKTKTVTQERKKCVAPLPPFGYSDSATVNSAAVGGALALVDAIFGDPVNDAALVKKAISKGTASCQLEMLKQADRLEDTILKEVNKAKKIALKDVTVTHRTALEEKLETLFSSSDKIGEAGEALETGVAEKCATLQDPESTFPGACASANLDAVGRCVKAAARCEACLEMNAFDGLDLDCDQVDDEEPNGSCPLAGL